MTILQLLHTSTILTRVACVVAVLAVILAAANLHYKSPKLSNASKWVFIAALVLLLVSGGCFVLGFLRTGC